MKRYLFITALLAVLIPSTLQAQQPSPAIVIKPEDRCSPYDRAHYPYPQTVEDEIIARMDGLIYSPYTGESFASKRETDIEHMIAVSEAHDSGLCAADTATRRAFARDLDNLTLAAPALNRNQKGAKDLAEWLPTQNRCWFVGKVIAAKKKYGLSMDAKEAAAALNVLAECFSLEMKIITPVENPPTATPIPTEPTVSGPSFTVNRNAVNVRSGPGVNYSVIGSVKRGETYTPNGRNQAGDWLRFPWSTGSGWVYAPLMVVQNVSGLPVVGVIPHPTQTPASLLPTNTPAATVLPTLLPPTNTPVPHTPELDAQYYKDLCGVGSRGWVTIALARQCGFSMPVCRSTNPGLYAAMHDRNGDGCVGE